MPTTPLPFFLFYKILLYNILRLWEQGHIWVYSIKKKCLNSRSGVVVVKAAVLLKRLTWRGRETLSLEDSPDAIVGVEECLTNKACLVAWLSCAHSSILTGWMDAWRDGRYFAADARVCCQYSLVLSLFLFWKEEMARQKLKRKRLSQPWNGAGPGWSKDT